MPTSEEEVIVGTTIGGRFRIDSRIAAGGMGVVYKAEQVPLGRPVAVKILRAPNDPRMDESFSKRFLLEAAAVANLAHPHTIVVHDYGRDGEVLYFAMEFLEGATLTGRVRKKGPMPPAEAIHVGKQIASSLQDAHEAGLVHRDLKPGNVMLISRGGDPNYVKVLDFGLVKMVSTEENAALTQSGIMLGSPRYMSPEQVRGKGDVDHRADIYSFGAMLCFMLTAKPPFPAGSQFEAMRAHVYTAPPALRELDPKCTASQRVQQLIHKCLAKKPDERFQSMAELLQALAHAELAPVDTNGAQDEKPTMMSAESPREQPHVAPQPLAPPAPTPTPSPAPSFTGPPQQEAHTQSFKPLPSEGASGSYIGPVHSPARVWGVRIAAGLLVVAGAAGAALLVGQNDDPVVEPLPPREPTVVETPVAPPTEMAADPVETQQVRTVVQSDPSPARVLRNGHDLGDTPLTLLMPEGAEWELELSARGYETRSIRLRGGVEPERLVRLERSPETTRMTTTTMRRPEPMVDTPIMIERVEMQMSMEPAGPIRNPWD